MAYGKYKGLTKRTQSDEILREKAFEMAFEEAFDKTFEVT